MKRTIGLGVGAGLAVVVATAYAATALRFGSAVNVSRTTEPTEKARFQRLTYEDGGLFRKPWLLTYADGPAGRQNVYAKASFDDGATWSDPVLLSHDGVNSPTGGQSIVARDSLGFVADNDKPSLVAPPVTTGPKVVISWTSAYCPPDPSAGHAGSYNNPLQGAGDLDGDGTPERPYHCVWVATTADPALAAWDVQQLTNGQRDAIGDVVAANSTGSAFAMAWQEDPAGLQPGEAEGPGDGGSGATVTGGTNIWYTHAPSPDGATLRANIAQLSDNDTVGTGQPGASRPNLQISGSTAAVAYEETACPGGSGGKCIVYHAFNYQSHDTDAAGTILSDVTHTARRVRFMLQGASAAGSSSLRTVVLWRESAVVAPGAPADIMVRRGFVDAVARPGSTGYLGSDLLADTPQNLTQVAAAGGNANAHRAVVRGGSIALGYDMTPDMDAANPEKTPVPTATYNYYVTRSIADGAPGSWTTPLNLSRLTDPSMRVVEPRLVPTPGTIVNPLTGMPDASDAQDANILFASFATEANSITGDAGRIYVARSTDQGASFEPFVPVSADTAGQSEAQLRAAPDGSSVMVLWMGEQTIGDPATKDAVMAMAGAVPIPDLRLSAGVSRTDSAGRGVVTLTVRNEGAGDATNVVLSGSLGTGLTLIATSEPGLCSATGSGFRCTLPTVPAGQSRLVTLTVGGAPGTYILTATGLSDSVENNLDDNAVSMAVELPPPAEGFGCTLGRGDRPVDPSLPLLAGVALIGLALRRVGAAPGPTTCQAGRDGVTRDPLRCHRVERTPGDEVSGPLDLRVD